jgi:hypothetical protein
VEVFGGERECPGGCINVSDTPAFIFCYLFSCSSLLFLDGNVCVG